MTDSKGKFVPANDNARRIEPFHRLFASGYLNQSPSVNASLYYSGERYRKDHETAARITERSGLKAVDYSRPIVSGGGFDPFRSAPPGDADKTRPYYESASRLDALGLRKLVEDIVVNARDLVEAGREYSGRQQAQQARSAAITALNIGLMVLRNYYAPVGARQAA